MAFVPIIALPGTPVQKTISLSPRRPRTRMAGLEAPVKEDVRTKLNNLLNLTAEPRTEPERVRVKVDPGRMYKVLIFNDEAHPKDYVTRVLLKVVPGLTPQQAWAIMNKAHTTGKAVVGIWIFEISEGYCEMLQSNGLRSNIEEV